MKITLDKIKSWYQFSVAELLQGEAVVQKGKSSQWTRRKELKNEKDLVYILLQVSYQGEESKSLVYTQFQLEDSEGYFNKAMPSDDYLDRTLCHGDKVEGGLLFSIYRDLAPVRLWFDTNVCYENSQDPILMDIALPLEVSSTRTQIFAKEELTRSYSKQMAENPNQEAVERKYQWEVLIQDVANRLGAPYKKTMSGYILRIPLAGGRKQNVIIHFSGKGGEANDMLTIGTICAPASDTHSDRIFLQLNTQMSYGAVGITKINGQDYYVITEMIPAFVLNTDIVHRAILYIATKGDWFEEKLTGGLDIQ